MYRLILVIIYASFISLPLSGCFGLGISSPVECVNETPYTAVHDLFPKRSKNTERVLPKVSTKADFLKEWGEPNKVISASENEEIWIYERKLWCGVIPMVIIPIPLLLRVCDGFDRIYFRDNQAKRLHTRHTSTGGFYIGIGGPGQATDKDCNYPIPFESTNSKGDKLPHNGPLISAPSYSIGDKIPDNAGLVVFYRPRRSLGSAGIHNVHVSENFLIPLYDGSYYPYLSTLGENEFWVQSFFSRNTLKVNVKSGQTYYVRFRVSFFKLYFEEVATEIAEEEIADLALISKP